MKTGMGKGYLKNRLKRFLFLEGFTLMEIMVVVIIIGILSAMAIPLYSKMIENSRITEATQMLGVIRDAEMKYAFEYGNYTLFVGTGPETWFLNLRQLGVDFNGIGKYFYIASLGRSSADPYNNTDDLIAVAGRNMAGGTFIDYRHSGTFYPFQNISFPLNYMIFINESGRLWSTQPEVDKAVRNY